MQTAQKIELGWLGAVTTKCRVAFVCPFLPFLPFLHSLVVVVVVIVTLSDERGSEEKL